MKKTFFFCSFMVVIHSSALMISCCVSKGTWWLYSSVCSVLQPAFGGSVKESLWVQGEGVPLGAATGALRLFLSFSCKYLPSCHSFSFSRPFTEKLLNLIEFVRFVACSAAIVIRWKRKATRPKTVFIFAGKLGAFFCVLCKGLFFFPNREKNCHVYVFNSSRTKWKPLKISPQNSERLGRMEASRFKTLQPSSW